MANFRTFLQLNCSNLKSNCVEDLTVTKIVKEIKFEKVWDKLELKIGFQRQSVKKYLRLTLVFM